MYEYVHERQLQHVLQLDVPTFGKTILTIQSDLGREISQQGYAFHCHDGSTYMVRLSVSIGQPRKLARVSRAHIHIQMK